MPYITLIFAFTQSALVQDGDIQNDGIIQFCNHLFEHIFIPGVAETCERCPLALVWPCQELRFKSLSFAIYLFFSVANSFSSHVLFYYCFHPLLGEKQEIIISIYNSQLMRNVKEQWRWQKHSLTELLTVMLHSLSTRGHFAKSMGKAVKSGSSLTLQPTTQQVRTIADAIRVLSLLCLAC